MAVTQYIGSRYVPLLADPVEWSSAKEYEPLTIVTHEGNSYTSRQFVPKGIDIDNEAYWALTGNYNAQIEQYRREVEQIGSLLPADDFSADNTVADFVAAQTLEATKDLFVTPYMFDAKGDGIEDDTVAFETMLQAENKNILIPFGTFAVSRTLVFPAGCHIICNGIIKSSASDTAIRLGESGKINHFHVDSLNVKNDGNCVNGIVIYGCVESYFANLTAQNFIHNIVVNANDTTATAYNTFVNPVCLNGTINFLISGTSSPLHCNENYLLGGRMFMPTQKTAQICLEKYASDWVIIGTSCEGTANKCLDIETSYNTIIDPRTEGTFPDGHIYFGSGSSSNKLYANRYDAAIVDEGTYNGYITVRHGNKLISATINEAVLKLSARDYQTSSNINLIESMNPNEDRPFKVSGDGIVTCTKFRTVGGGWNLPLTLRNTATNPYNVWVASKGNLPFVLVKTGTASSEFDGTIVGHEHRETTYSPLNIITPYFVGDMIFDTQHKNWYIACGDTSADWKALTS